MFFVFTSNNLNVCLFLLAETTLESFFLGTYIDIKC